MCATESNLTVCAVQCPCLALRSLSKGCGVTAFRIRSEDPTGDVFPLDCGVLIEQIPSTSMEMLGTFTDEFFHSMRMCLHNAEALKVFSCFHADSSL